MPFRLIRSVRRIWPLVGTVPPAQVPRIAPAPPLQTKVRAATLRPGAAWVGHAALARPRLIPAAPIQPRSQTPPLRRGTFWTGRVIPKQVPFLAPLPPIQAKRRAAELRKGSAWIGPIPPPQRAQPVTRLVPAGPVQSRSRAATLRPGTAWFGRVVPKAVPRAPLAVVRGKPPAALPVLSRPGQVGKLPTRTRLPVHGPLLSAIAVRPRPALVWVGSVPHFVPPVNVPSPPRMPVQPKRRTAELRKGTAWLGLMVPASIGPPPPTPLPIATGSVDPGQCRVIDQDSDTLELDPNQCRVIFAGGGIEVDPNKARLL